MRGLHYGLLGGLHNDDWPWLLKSLRSGKLQERREVSLHALLALRPSRKVDGSDVELSNAVADNAALQFTLVETTRPAEPNPDIERMDREHNEFLERTHAAAEQQLVLWRKWREKMLADPDSAFAPSQDMEDIRNVYTWLGKRDKSRSRYGIWNESALREVFGEQVTARARSAFQELWRRTDPVLWSQRSPENRNQLQWSWVLGLCGLQAESATSGWANRLSYTEAARAAAYATIELNGFSEWLKDVAAAHPVAVDTVIGGELEAELTLDTEATYLPVVLTLANAEHQIKKALAPRVLKLLKTWAPSASMPDAAGRRSAHLLDQALKVITADENAALAEGCGAVADLCEARVAHDTPGPIAIPWLRALFRIDAERGAHALRDALSKLPQPAATTFAIDVLASIVAGADGGTPLNFRDLASRVRTFEQLVRCAYDHVKPSEDQSHKGVYSPNARDEAQKARGYFLSMLLETPGPDAQNAIGRLAADSAFSASGDRLLYLAKQRAARDVDIPAKPSDVRALEQQHEIPPRDSAGILATMVDRLDDLQHDVSHDDFSERNTLRTIKVETEMQVAIAARLRSMARGAYIVTREEEVADRKEPDIRLLSTVGPAKAAIEVKIADGRWSFADLEQALSAQLVGQYLRHETCRAGCLLLTYDGSRTEWPADGGATQLTFSQVVERLRDEAKAIEVQMNFAVRVVVKPLDLTDPLLLPVRPRSGRRLRKKPANRT